MKRRNTFLYRLLVLILSISMIMPAASAFAENSAGTDENLTLAEEQVPEGQKVPEKEQTPDDQKKSDGEQLQGQAQTDEQQEEAGTQDAGEAENKDGQQEGQQDENAAEKKDESSENQEDGIDKNAAAPKAKAAPVLKAAAVNVRPQIGVYAPYFRFSDDSTLPEKTQFSVHMTFVADEGGNRYTFDRDVTKVYEIFEGRTTMATGKYSVTIGLGSTGSRKWKYSGEETVTVYVGENGNLYWDEELSNPCRFQFDFTGNYEFPIHVNIIDKDDGHKLTNEEIGSGIDINYVIYWSAYYRDTGKYNPYGSGLPLSRLFQEEGKKKKITSQGQLWEVEVPDAPEGYANDTFNLRIQSDEIYSGNYGSYKAEEPVRDTEVFYYGHATYALNGWPYAEPGSKYSLRKEGNEFFLDVIVDQDLMNNPSVNIEAFGPETKFPVKVEVTMQRNTTSDVYRPSSYGSSAYVPMTTLFGEPEIQKTVVTVNSEGRVSVPMPFKTVNNSSAYHMTWQVINDSGEYNDDWDKYGDEYVNRNEEGLLWDVYHYKGFDYENWYTNYSEGESLIWFRYAKVENVSLPIHSFFADETDTEKFFPVYVKVDLTPSYSGSVKTYTAVKKLENAADANSRITFNESIPKGESFNLRYTFYSDEAMTKKSSLWQNGTMEVALDEQNRLVSGGAYGGDYPQEAASLKLYQLGTYLDVSAHKAPDDLFPKYVQIEFKNRQDSSLVVSKVQKVDRAGDQGEVYFDYMAYGDDYYNSVWFARTRVYNTLNADGTLSDEDENWTNHNYINYDSSYDYRSGDKVRVENSGLVRCYNSYYGDYSSYYRKNKNGFFVANPVWKGSSIPNVTIPIKTTVKPGKEEEAFRYVSTGQRLDVTVERITTDSSGYSSRTTVASTDRYITEAGDSSISLGELYPGTYYVNFHTERYYHQNQWYQWWPRMEGWKRSAVNGDVVTITEDGRVLAQDGSDYYVDNKYTGNIPYGSPKLFVNTTVPDDVSNISTTLSVTLTGVNGTDTARISETRTARVDDDHFGVFGYYYRRYDSSDPNTDSNYYFFVSSDYGVGGSSYEHTLPAGDYDLSYHTVDYNEPYEEGSGNNISKAWISGSNIRIHIDEEGNVTKDGQPYVIPNYMLPDVKQFTFDIETKVTEGVQKAFTAGDKVRAYLLSRAGYMLAVGDTEVTEEGIKSITLNALGGQYINPGLGLTGKNNDQYYVTFHTLHSDNTPNRNWHSRMGVYNTSSSPTIQDPIPVYVKTDGTVLDAKTSTTYAAKRLTLDNYSLLLPFDKSQKPDAVKQTENGAITFNTINDISKIADGSHYMIVTQNKFDGKFYAMSYADGKGDQVLLEDVNSLEDLEKGYILGENDIGTKPYIFSANKSSYSESSVSAQFRSGVKDSSGKYISLKLGTSAKEYLPLMANSAGTVTVRFEEPRTEKTALFSINKNNYSFVGYNNEFLGFSGFTVYSNRYPSSPYVYYENDANDSYFYTTGNYIDINKTGNQNVYIADKPYGMGANDFVYEVDQEYGEKAYYEKLGVDFADISSGDGVLSPMSNTFIILTDNQQNVEETPNNTYKLVKTFGDFNNTFTYANQTSMLLVYTDEDGKEYALNPKGLVQVKTKDGSADYRTVTAGADNEFIANNNSRTWSQNSYTTYFGFRPVDIDGTAAQVFAGVYSMRKSRSNTYEGGEYLTMNPDVMGSDDKNYDYNSQIYVMHPTAKVRNEVDWGKATSYKLSVMRGGNEVWLGVKDGKMTVVSSEDDAVVFDVYAPSVERYYEASNSDEFNPYYKISTLDDINADDEILITYDNNGKKEILACTTTDWGYSEATGSSSLYPSVYVSDKDEPVDVSTTDDFPADFRYRYRTDTYGEVKHVYAYTVSDNMIMAQGGATNAIGSAKGTPTKKQEKYESVVGLGQNAQYKLWIKEPGWTNLMYYNQKAEVNFFYEDGQFYIRGGKSDAWLGHYTYTKQVLDPVSNQYVNETHSQFATTDKDGRIPVEIYRRGTLDNIKVNYYDINNLDGDPKKTEIKPEGILGLPQDEDLKHDGEDYIFVGWTRDKEKAGFLGKDESANIFDFNDISRVASVRDDVKEARGLLGDCDPEASNTIKVLARDLGEEHELDLYPVYAWRGRTEVVSWDEKGKMVIGISDYKDLQGGHDGSIDPRERWLGSIDIEVYRDGELVRPTRTNGRFSTMAAASDITARMYFAYHNDDAADLNIKFIADTVTKEALKEYLRDGDFSTTYPSDDYIIDAVFAEQGGSEDGLKYMYNWLDPERGGQLDNVRGGSAVKIYLTSKYQVKYYFDDDGDEEYQELTDEAHQNNNYYTTPGTEEAVNANTAAADYVVQNVDGNEYRKLMQQTPSDTTKFVDEKIRRGEYSYFQYLFNEYPHVIPVAALPEAPAGQTLDSDVWTIKNASMADTDEATPEGTYDVTGTVYGTGSTKHSYESTELKDKTNTFHLYIAVEGETTTVKATKVWKDEANNAALRPDPEKFAESIHLYAGDTEVKDYTPEITDNEDDTYTIKYSNLPRTDENDQRIVYTIKEDPVDGYAAETDTAENGGTITNILEGGGESSDLVVISLTKNWDDSSDKLGIRPSADEFKDCITLLQNGKAYEAEPLISADGDVYTITYGSLPEKDDEGTFCEYEVQESSIPAGYKVVGSDKAAPGEILTNKLDMGSLKITKTLASYDENSASGQDGKTNKGTFVFSVTAVYKDEVVYDDVVSFTFDGTDTQTKVIENKIPVGAEVTVKEIYSGSQYTLDSDDTIKVEIVSSASEEEQKDAAFTNVYDDTVSKGYGINNEYRFTGGKWEHVDSQK